MRDVRTLSEAGGEVFVGHGQGVARAREREREREEGLEGFTDDLSHVGVITFDWWSRRTRITL